MEYPGKIRQHLAALESELLSLDRPQAIAVLNEMNRFVLQKGAFASEPVSAIQWVKSDLLQSNNYNPNTIAPPEMKLLAHSLLTDGFTQPLVVIGCGDGRYEIVDGFHRHFLCMNNARLKKRLGGYVPVVVLSSAPARQNHIAATIRHNRARGKHQVQAMSLLVLELLKSGWSERRIAKELGMEADEVLRLQQLDGLSELFRQRSYSQAWTTK